MPLPICKLQSQRGGHLGPCGCAQIASMKDYVARFGHGSAKLARQAQSKEKVLAKMVRGGLTEKVKADAVVRTRYIL